MNDHRPAKRIRQACEPCRRKKSKCSGEKPTCSACWRLKQQCFYNGNPLQPVHDYAANAQNPNPRWGSPSQTRATENLDNRIVTLESTVHRILDTLQENRPSVETSSTDQSFLTDHGTHDNTVTTVMPPLITIIGAETEANHSKEMRRREVQDLGRTYLAYCADQPLPLFPKEGFVESLPDRNDATLFAIIANALRYENHIEYISRTRDSHVFRDAAHSNIMSHIAQGSVEVSTLQALCLVVLFDYATGHMKTASSLTALASILGSSVDFRSNSSGPRAWTSEENRCCYWSIVLLGRLLGITAPMSSTLDSRLLPYPRSCSMPVGAIIRPEFRRAYEQSCGDNGVMVFVMEMSEEWAKVMGYVRDCLSFRPDVSPWLTTSKYAAALAGVMSIETRLQSLHRYKHVFLRDLTLEDLEACRQYWAPWFLSRFLYHTMVCLLNHPLLITLQLQAKGNDSELFRQQSSFYVTRHVHWILHFIAFIETRRFRVTDPILGYCAAVVATIESQLIYSVDEVTAQRKERNIESCRRLIRSLAPAFPCMKELDQNLGTLSEVISATYVSNINSAASVSVDLSRIRDLLDICPLPHTTIGPSMNDPEFMAQSSANERPNTSQWVRLSRRPSVDQPDDSVLSTEDGIPTETHLAGNMQANTPRQNLTASCAQSDLPADLFFNGISQDISSWWNAFDTYDPDNPNF